MSTASPWAVTPTSRTGAAVAWRMMPAAAASARAAVTWRTRRAGIVRGISRFWFAFFEIFFSPLSKQLAPPFGLPTRLGHSPLLDERQRVADVLGEDHL